ncbi:MAG: OmpA family protein [Methylophilus sp.]|uniref:OmpA family protein n=1 Tax=Methylophilus sp. TaxID=29541 RepID=UPI003F9F9119
MKQITLILLAALAASCASTKKAEEPVVQATVNPDLQPYYDSDYIQSTAQAAQLELAPQHVIALMPKRHYVVVTVDTYPPAKPALDLSKFLAPPKQAQKPVDQPAEKHPEPTQYILYFDHDKSTLKKGEQEKLDKILSATPKTAKISITSHADQDGDKGYNQKLSEKRSSAVKSKFAKAGFDNIESHAYGETKLADPRNTSKAKAKNRRSEIEVQ